MKFIFDFDDVIFYATRRRMESTYPKLKSLGISHEDIDDYYEKNRKNLFSQKKLLAHFNLKEEYYEEMMRELKEHQNSELIEIIRKLGKENCYLVSFGDDSFQRDKINRLDVHGLFSEIIIVQKSKKETIENIAFKHKDERVVFIDDKERNFEDLDFKKYPNLTTILYDENGLRKLTEVIEKE